MKAHTSIQIFKFSSEIAAGVASHSWKKPECVIIKVHATLEMANASATSCEARASQMFLGPLQCMGLQNGSTSKRQQRSQEGTQCAKKLPAFCSQRIWPGPKRSTSVCMYVAHHAMTSMTGFVVNGSNGHVNCTHCCALFSFSYKNRYDPPWLHRKLLLPLILRTVADLDSPFKAKIFFDSVRHHKMLSRRLWSTNSMVPKYRPCPCRFLSS